jgi:hypothetical protein
MHLGLTLILAVGAAGFAFMVSPGKAATPVSDRLGTGVVSIPDIASALGQGQVDSTEPMPEPIVTATASAKTPKARPTRKPVPTPTASASASPTTSAPTSLTPLGGANYAGQLILNDTGAQTAAWNATSSYCPETSGFVGDGTVGTNSSSDVTLTTTSTSGSCVGLISPGSYASDVIEADIYFPALPGSPDTLANWTGIWLTDGAEWPMDGELDANESEPVNGVDAVSWHSGTADDEFSASTDDFFQTQLPKLSTNLTPGWHVVDIVYTQGFFAVYYDGHEYTQWSSSNITGDPLNIYLTMVNTPDISSIVQRIGGNPVNSDSDSPTLEMKYVRVWQYQ